MKHVLWRGEAYTCIGGKPEGKRPLGKPGCKWEDIKIDVHEVGFGVRDRDIWRVLVNVVMNFGFHEVRGIYRQAEIRLASQEGFCFME
jgi:hypothetical protein